jgi:hypothetical protein
MTKYDVPVWKMCYEAAKELPEIFRPIDIIRKIKEKRPDVKENTIRAHVISLAPNHPSFKHYGMKHKLFFYLGNGNFRLLSEKESTFHLAPTKEKAKDDVTPKTSLYNADRLLNMGMYSQAMREYGTILERLLKQLYIKQLPDLPVEYKEKIVDYEKEVRTPIRKFTIGQWIGLFRKADLFRHIAKEMKKKDELFIFFIPAILDVVNKLRNVSTHPMRENEIYISKDSALFVKSAVTCILQELGE